MPKGRASIRPRTYCGTAVILLATSHNLEKASGKETVMQRRSAVGRLAAAAAGLSLGTVPSLEAALPLEENSFTVTSTNLAASSGVVTCPVCQEMADALDLTPAGPCLSCADQNPALRAEPYSDTFWVLSPREVQPAGAGNRAACG